MTFGYDAGAGQLSRLTSMSDASGSASFTYDAFGNLSDETRNIGGQASSTQYYYDADDTLTAIVYPSGRRVDCSRNSLGQVTTVATTFDGSTQTVASGIGYAPFGPLTVTVPSTRISECGNMNISGRLSCEHGGRPFAE